MKINGEGSKKGGSAERLFFVSLVTFAAFVINGILHPIQTPP